MSFVVEARMDSIKKLSNEQRIRIENNLTNAIEKIERFGYKFTPDQHADWAHIIKFLQMKLALDDIAVVLADNSSGTVDTKSVIDNALEIVRLYYTSLKLRRQRFSPPPYQAKRPDSPYVRTEIFIPCESCQPVHDTGGAMLATLMLPDDNHVGVPMIVHPQEHRCSGEMVYNWRGAHFRCDNDDDPACPKYKPGALPPADEDLYA